VMAYAQGRSVHLVDVSQICQLLRMGLAENRLPGVQQIIDDWCMRHQITSFINLKQRTDTEPTLLQSLIDSIIVAETFFFRHYGHFDFVRQHILPPLCGLNRPVRILSAGCATGEEAYSLAMLLNAEMPDLQYRIFACDISDANIRAAKEGIYKAWSLRDQQSWPQMQRYLEVVDDKKYRVKDVIRHTVTFFSCNLVEDFIEQSMFDGQSFDLIFCRNMMIYLTEPEVQKLSHRLMSLLAPLGWLVPGPSDPINAYLTRLAAMESSNGLIFRNLPLPPGKPTQRNNVGQTLSGQPRVVLTKKQHAVKYAASVLRRPERTAPLNLSMSADGLHLAANRQAVLEQQINDMLQQGNVHAALARINQQLLNSPLCTEAYLLQALIYWQLDQYDCALASLDKALYLAPDSPVPCYLSAKLLQKQGYRAPARRQLLRAQQALARMDQQQPLPLTRLGTVAELATAVTTALAANSNDLDRST
jgi:chemotaxis protein methyltransferase CheR